MQSILKKIVQQQRDKYYSRVGEAQKRMQVSSEEIKKAQVAATPPPPVDSKAYKRLSRSTLLITVAVVLSAWISYMAWAGEFHLFLKNWFMSVTMVFGSFIAGSTSEGGGAVAFPVMTLLFKIDPACARNFSLAIQSLGMTAAAFAIWRCKIPVERNAICFSSLGGAIGIIFGTFFIVPLFTNPAFTKMFFAALWLSFIVALYMINRNKERKIYYQIVDFKPMRAGLLLIAVGVLGGIVTSLTGSGLDILTFAFLSLRYRICEKVATPTSVVLMAFNSIFGFLTHLFLVSTPKDGIQYWLGDFQMEARDYWLVCIPVVILGAPAGARFIREKSRHFVTAILYSSILIQFVAAILIIKPSGWLLGFTLIVFCTGTCLFIFLAITGHNRIDLKLPLFQDMTRQDSLRS
jgi:uncharacterized membrane protein YfcA